MAKKRFIVELGTGADLHGNDVTKAACRAVKDAVSRSCLCGILEILNRKQFQGVHVEVLVACPRPDQVDVEAVKAQIPIGTPSVSTTAGGMCARGICVSTFAEGCDTIMVANTAVTVWIDIDSEYRG
ncbi:Lin0512 family protein [Desulfospira joergensenii]|uniref:Lin0512 family protein n=1 Tax=Desulfospira joergensenii TaxID=53329 RepID=UPI0003B5AFEC|nr:Lin0512 family protein [Desulfospira joergensenii]